MAHRKTLAIPLTEYDAETDIESDALELVNVPEVRRNWWSTSLQFNRAVTQSRMLTWWPSRLLVGYTRTMMAALLWQPAPQRIGMIGLGGGSQAKFIHRCLPHAQLEVVDNNAAVIALRERFHLPEDGPQLTVIHGDGAQFVHGRAGCFDILLVDAYDVTGIPKALSTQRYYDACRDALSEGGVMASNLFCADDRQLAVHLGRIRRSFGVERVLVVEEPGMRNQVVFAWTGEPLPQGAWALPVRARQIAPRARRALKPVLVRVHAALMLHSRSH